MRGACLLSRSRLSVGEVASELGPCESALSGCTSAYLIDLRSQRHILRFIVDSWGFMGLCQFYLLGM